MLDQISDGIYMADRTVIVVGQESLLLIEPGYDAIVKGQVSGSSVEVVLCFSEQQGRPIRYLTYTHAHGDHVGNLPMYLKKIDGPKRLYAHANSPLPEKLIDSLLLPSDQITLLSTDTSLTLDGIVCDFLYTPGHSRSDEDISIYLPQSKLLFVGDLLQPQGPSYRNSDGLSPVPYFHQGDFYLKSLARLATIDFEIMITGHGQIFDRRQGLDALAVTQQCVQRIRQLAGDKPGDLAQMCQPELCEAIYDIIVAERNFYKILAQQRKQRPSARQKSDYELYDLPGILYFVSMLGF